jgi:hypothetical protein
VKSRTRSSHSALRSGLMFHLTTMKITADSFGCAGARARPACLVQSRRYRSHAARAVST